MTDITYTLSATGDETILNSMIDSVARKRGWSEESTETKLKTVETAIRRFLEEEALAYNTAQARLQAEAQTIAATQNAMQNITLVLTQS